MKIYIIVLVFLTLQIHAFCQKLELRPSIGWGHGFGHNYEIKTNDNNTPYTVTFDKPFKPSIELPQLGFMIDFNYKNKWIISLGRMHGKTELKSTINGATHSAALIQKWGGNFYTQLIIIKTNLEVLSFVEFTMQIIQILIIMLAKLNLQLLMQLEKQLLEVMILQLMFESMVLY
jgi:hypothetical protein